MLSEYEAHAKRIWSVDYCGADPALLASASDDCTVRVWSSRAAGALAQLDLPANVCSARWRPGCPYTIAAGCADHAVYVYDLRAPGRPLHTLLGHG
jgi:WD40 repeat protein